MNCRGKSGLKPCSPAIVMGLENYSLFETRAIRVIHHEPVDKLASFYFSDTVCISIFSLKKWLVNKTFLTN